MALWRLCRVLPFPRSAAAPSSAPRSVDEDLAAHLFRRLNAEHEAEALRAEMYPVALRGFEAERHCPQWLCLFLAASGADPLTHVTGLEHLFVVSLRRAVRYALAPCLSARLPRCSRSSGSACHGVRSGAKSPNLTASVASCGTEPSQLSNCSAATPGICRRGSLSFARSAPPRASPRPRPPGGGPPSVLAARRAEFGSHPRRGMASHVADRGCRGKASRWPLRSWSPRLGKGKATGHSRLRRDLSRREARSAGVGARAASC